ncbi:MAG: hypothetical protein WDZ30_06530 [Cellvibrionaceae bacterium]
MAGNNLNKEIDTLKEDIVKLSNDVAALLGVFKDLGAETVGDAANSLNEEVAKRREEFRETLLGAKAQGDKVAEGLEEEIVQHPLRSVLVAFGVGYVLAKLMRGK